MNKQQVQAFTQQEINDIKAQAVMEFVNVQVGAFESGFVVSNCVSLYSMYRFAQHHVKDNYGLETKLMSEEWGNSITELARDDSERKSGGKI